jgi:hypothetical protein
MAMVPARDRHVSAAETRAKHDPNVGRDGFLDLLPFFIRQPERIEGLGLGVSEVRERLQHVVNV